MMIIQVLLVLLIFAIPTAYASHDGATITPNLIVHGEGIRFYIVNAGGALVSGQQVIAGDEAKRFHGVENTGTITLTNVSVHTTLNAIESNFRSEDGVCSLVDTVNIVCDIPDLAPAQKFPPSGSYKYFVTMGVPDPNRRSIVNEAFMCADVGGERFCTSDRGAIVMTITDTTPDPEPMDIIEVIEDIIDEILPPTSGLDATINNAGGSLVSGQQIFVGDEARRFHNVQNTGTITLTNVKVQTTLAPSESNFRSQDGICRLVDTVNIICDIPNLAPNQRFPQAGSYQYIITMGESTKRSIVNEAFLCADVNGQRLCTSDRAGIQLSGDLTLDPTPDPAPPPTPTPQPVTCPFGTILVNNVCVQQETPAPSPIDPSPPVFDFQLGGLTFTMVWTQEPHPQTGELPASFTIYWTPDMLFTLSNSEIKFLGTVSGGDSGTFVQTVGDSGLHCFVALANWDNYGTIQSNTKCIDVVEPDPTPPPFQSECPSGFIRTGDLCIQDISALTERLTGIETGQASILSSLDNLRNTLANLVQQFQNFLQSFGV